MTDTLPVASATARSSGPRGAPCAASAPRWPAPPAPTPLLWRVLVVVLAFFGGLGVVLYLVGLVTIPREGEPGRWPSGCCAAPTAGCDAGQWLLLVAARRRRARRSAPTPTGSSRWSCSPAWGSSGGAAGCPRPAGPPRRVDPDTLPGPGAVRRDRRLAGRRLRRPRCRWSRPGARRPRAPLDRPHPGLTAVVAGCCCSSAPPAGRSVPAEVVLAARARRRRRSGWSPAPGGAAPAGWSPSRACWGSPSRPRRRPGPTLDAGVGEPATGSRPRPPATGSASARRRSTCAASPVREGAARRGRRPGRRRAPAGARARRPAGRPRRPDRRWVRSWCSAQPSAATASPGDRSTSARRERRRCGSTLSVRTGLVEVRRG